MGVCSQYRGVTLVLSRLAQLVERKTLNLVVVGSSPTVGAFFVFSFLVLLACLLAEKAFTSIFCALVVSCPDPNSGQYRSCGAVGSAWVS